MTIEMEIMGVGDDVVQLERGHIKVRAPGRKWTGPGLPRRGGKASVKLNEKAEVVSVKPVASNAALTRLVRDMDGMLSR